MNDTMRELLPQWITALRSERFRQGNSVLRDTYDNAYCCLGVLCHIHPKVRWNRYSGSYTYTPDLSSSKEYLPSGLATSLGVNDRGDLVALNDTGKTILHAQTTHLAKLNDDEGFDFDAIADVLQGVLDGHIDLT